MKKELVRVAFPVSVEAHKQLKLFCVQHGQTIAQVIKHALEQTYKELDGAFTAKPAK